MVSKIKATALYMKKYKPHYSKGKYEVTVINYYNQVS